MLKAGTDAIDAVSESFSPRNDASSRQIRLNGLQCLCIGLLCFLCSCSIIFFFPKQATIAMLPMMLAYTFIVVGGYRIVFGKSPKPAHVGEVSLMRIVFAVGTIVTAVCSLLGLLLLLKFFIG